MEIPFLYSSRNFYLCSMYSADCISAVKAKIKIKQSNYTVSCIHHVFCRWYDSKLHCNHTVVRSSGQYVVNHSSKCNQYIQLTGYEIFLRRTSGKTWRSSSNRRNDTYQIFLKIIIPLSKPIIATMCLFYMVTMWNEWFTPMLYLDSKDKWPVALYVRQLVEGANNTEIGSSDASSVQATDKICNHGINIYPDYLCLSIRTEILCTGYDNRSSKRLILNKF